MKQNTNNQTTEQQFQKEKKTSVVSFAARLSTIVFFGGVISAIVFLLFVMIKTDRINNKDRAVQASAWLSQRLSVVGKDERNLLLQDVSAQINAKSGLFYMSGTLKGASLLDQVSQKEIKKILLGELDEVTIGGQKYFISASPLSPPLSSLSVVVAIEQINYEGLNPFSFHFIVANIIIFLLLFFTSICYGLEIRSQLLGLIRKIQIAVQNQDGNIPLVPGCVCLEELIPLANSVDKLGYRINAEMAMYLDARDEVEILDDHRTDMLTAVSLDLYEPLDKVVSLSKRLLAGKDGVLNDSQTEDVRIIQKAGIRLRSMVREIVDLSTLVSGHIVFDPNPVDLIEVISEVVNEARGQIGNKELKIELSNSIDNAAFINGNRQRLCQIFSNLFSNAIKFTESGSITLTMSRADDQTIEILIADTGVGIDPREIKSIFDIYQQLGSAAKRKRGTGLGLTICKRLVVLHGGTIAAKSYVGQGTTFIVQLPEVL